MTIRFKNLTQTQIRMDLDRNYKRPEKKAIPFIPLLYIFFSPSALLEIIYRKKSIKKLMKFSARYGVSNTCFFVHERASIYAALNAIPCQLAGLFVRAFVKQES